jgi:hypothetical protein
VETRTRTPHRRDAYARRGTAVFSVLALMLTTLVVLGDAAVSLGSPLAGPSIAFLNPSSFSEAGERGIIVSNRKPDTGPGCCSEADDTYRLAAWVADPPPTYNVFFTVTQGALEFEITNTRQVVNGTWQAEWSLPSTLLDGPATINAYIVVGEEAVAAAEVDVTIMRIQENIDLAYPVADGTFGTFAPLAVALPAQGPAEPKKPTGVVDALFTNTPEMVFVRAFYTTSAPGTVPTWRVCGTESVGPNNSNADNGLKCTLRSAAEQSAITAVAAVANDSPNDYDNRFNQSGDAVALLSSYAQVPTVLDMDGGQQVIPKHTPSGRLYCSDNVVTTLTDQAGRQIAGANMDVHAEGPSDALKFDTFAVLTSNQAPDRGDHREEDGYDCTGSSQGDGTPPTNANPDTQGEHARFGAPDRKHIESLSGGTSDIGRFSFALHADEGGTTLFTAWVDERDDGCHANDDLFTEGEVNVSGSIGWVDQAPEPQQQPLETIGSCGVTESPSPDPTGGPGPGNDPDERRVSLFAARGASAGTLRLYGRVSSSSECRASQQVKIQMKAKRRYRVIGRPVTNARGKYSFERRSPGVRTYRALVPRTPGCAKARSKTVKAG